MLPCGIWTKMPAQNLISDGHTRTGNVVWSISLKGRVKDAKTRRLQRDLADNVLVAPAAPSKTKSERNVACNTQSAKFRWGIQTSVSKGGAPWNYESFRRRGHVCSPMPPKKYCWQGLTIFLHLQLIKHELSFGPCESLSWARPVAQIIKDLRLKAMLSILRRLCKFVLRV